MKRHNKYDLVILSELSVQFAPVAFLVAKRFRAKLVTDCFVGMYETNVEDWGESSRGSLKSRLYRVADTAAVALSDLALIDTEMRAEFIKRSKPVLSVPVGAPAWASAVTGPKASHDVFRILYYGNYIPLHGLNYVLDALVGLDRIRWNAVFVGDGKLRQQVESHARLANLDNIKFINPVEETALASFLEDSDVVLGIFGQSSKAASVIANKVWQGLAAGRIVATRTSLALNEIDGIVGEQLVQVDPQSPHALTEQLERISATERAQYYPDSAEKLSTYVQRKLNELEEVLRSLVNDRN